MSPAVSVVIPSYNHAPYIIRAVRSVLNQTLVDLELILIDDGSTDSSVSRLSEITDSRLCVLTQHNQGAHNTLNKGLRLASGRYLAILNSDDEYAPDRLMLAVAALEDQPAVSFVSTWIEVVDENGVSLGVKQGWENLLPWASSCPDLSFAQTGDFTRNLLQSNFISTTSNIVMRRELFHAVGDFRPLRFAHDWDFCLRALSTHQGALLKRPLLRYRVHGSNTIRQDPTAMIFEICWVLAANLPSISRRILRDADSPHALDFALRLYHSLHTANHDRLFIVLQTLQNAFGLEGHSTSFQSLLELDSPLRAWCLEVLQSTPPSSPPLSSGESQDGPEPFFQRLARQIATTLGVKL